MMSTEIVFIEVLICIFINLYLVKSIWKIRSIDVNQLNLVTKRYQELYSLQIGDLPKITKPFLEHINSLEELLEKTHKLHPNKSDEKSMLEQIRKDLNDLKIKVNDPLTLIDQKYSSVNDILEK